MKALRKDALSAKQSPLIKESLMSSDGFGTGYLLDTLRSHGNTVGEDHALAVGAIPELASEILSGARRGRYRFGLACGMGKTTAIRAVLRAVYQLGLRYRIAVACSKVEELCAFKRLLQAEDDIPESMIGLMHSYECDPIKARNNHPGYASLPSEGHDRQFLLVTHANVQSATEEERAWKRAWMRDCDLVFFDESLIVGEAQSLVLTAIKGACVIGEWGDLKARSAFYPELAPVVAWFDAVIGRLVDEVMASDGSRVHTVKLSAPDLSLTAGFKTLRVFATDRMPNLARLIELVERAKELRVFAPSGADRALISYRTSVPEELDNVIVLDASDPIRELVHHDARMQRAEDVLPSLARFKDVPGGMASIKRHARVQFYFANDAGGRETMRRAFSAKDGRAMPWAVEKVIRLIKSKPTESFLVFTYKDRDGVEYGRTLQRALERAGIAYPDIGADGNGRLNILTWGQETATNAYSHVQNVILLGVIFQREDVLASRFLGQVNDLRHPGVAQEVRSLRMSEAAHSIYQAINRARMRQVDVIDGVSQAKPCNVYLWHRDSEIEERLAPVLHGVPPWLPWREEGESVKASDVTRLIVAELAAVAARGGTEIPTRALKQAVASRVPGKTWRRARDAALAIVPWTLSGHTLRLIQFDPVN